MAKTEKCYYYFIGVTVLLGILNVIVFSKLHPMQGYVTQNEYFALISWSHSLIIGFAFSLSITIVLRSIIRDLDLRIITMQFEIESLQKLLADKETDEIIS